MNLETLTKSPHFRSYWIPQNITELSQYAAAISVDTRASGELREERILLRAKDIAPAWNEPAVGELMRLVPASASVYRAWASPSAGKAFESIRKKILTPRSEAPVDSKIAPVAALSGGAVGDETELETRIDEPPLETGAPDIGSELWKLLLGMQLDAMLEVGSSRVLPDGVFVATDFGVALLAGADWDAAAARDAVAAAFEKQLTTAHLGARWIEGGTGANTYFELDGLQPLALAARGKILVVATSKDLLAAMLAGVANPASAPGARYAAGYRHSKELPNFVKMMRLIDNPLAKESKQDPPEPAFFSGNIASLGQVLGRIESQSIVVHDTGVNVTENVVYRLK
jgi:hypothetical protein